MSNVVPFSPSGVSAPSAPVPPLRHPPAAVLAAAPARSLPATGGRRGEYGIGDLARELRLNHRPIRAIIDTLRALHRHSGLPLPRTPRIEKGLPVTGARAIYRGSRWDAGEFDAWLEGRGPTAPASAAAPRGTAAALRAEMAERARMAARA